MMKSLYLTAAAALLLTSTTAFAGNNSVSFQIEGQKIHVEQPKGCNSLSCIQITAPGLSKSFNLKNLNLDGFKSKDDDDDVATTTTPTQPAPQPAPAPAAAPAPQAPAPVVNTVPPAPPAAAPAPAPVTSYAPPAIAPVAAPTTPIGVWATEENKGNVRIELCGPNLCGYAEGSGEKVLINMKPSENNKWIGRIHDPDGGGNYDSTIAMRGPNILKVQGCAFGGMFCGGQTWKRIS